MTGDFDNAERRVLAALYVDHHRSGDRLLGLEELRTIYSVNVEPKVLRAVIADLEERGMVQAFYTKEDSSAALLPRGYKEAHAAIFSALGRPATLKIDWKKEDVWSEAPAPSWFPVPEGWKWFQLPSTVEQPPTLASQPLSAGAVAEIDWQKWGVILAAVGIVVTIALAFV